METTNKKKLYAFGQMMENYLAVIPHSALKFAAATTVGYAAVNNELDLATVILGGAVYTGAEYLKDKHQDKKNQKLISDLERTINKTG